jgi:hypothetical protein
MAFALSATPTAGTGTLSISANGTIVSGTGTQFLTEGLLGKVILIGRHNALVTAVASATSMTINRAPSFAFNNVPFTFVNNGTTINQTGTDNNLSGLSAITGVFNLIDGTAPSIQSLDLGQLPLFINGTLTIPDTWWLKATGGAAGNVLRVGATGRLIIDARRTITRPEGSVVVNSLGCGIIIRKPSGVPFSVNTIQFDSGSQFEQYGGIVETSGAVRWITSTTSLATFRQATWYVYDRNGNGYMNLYVPLTKPSVDGWKILSNDAVNPGFLSTLDAGFSIKGFEVIGGLNAITAIDGTTAMVRLDNFIGGFSRFDFQVRVGGTVTNEGPVGGYDFYNANIGNNLKAAPNATANNTTGRARHYVSYTPTFLDAGTSAGIVGGVLYLKDSNSGSRVTNNGVPNDKIYINTSGAGGVFPQIELLTKVWSGLGFNPMNQDDRLPINGYFWDYNQLGTPVNITNSIGPQSPTLYAPADVNVTLSRTAASALIGAKFTFNTVNKKITVIANASYDDLYDANKAFKCTSPQVNLETPILNQLIITPNGSDLEAYTAWTLEVATGVTLSQGTKFNKVKFDTVTIVGTGAITGVYQDSAGTSTVLEINPPSDDYSLCVFKADGTTKYFASDVNAGSYYVYFAPNEAGTYFLAAEKYGQKRTEDILVLNGGNVWYNITDQEDVGITDNFATASAYTTLSTTSEIYDATAVFRLTETGIKLGQLVARDGLYLDFGNYNVKIKDDATAIVAVASGTITYKSIVINESLKYNAMKATPPKTITPTDTEIINVLIEDANGDSQVSILGGDNLGYELWKVTTATATDDYATGTLLTTLATNAAPYRFIGISGFDIVGRDVSSGVRRRSSMLKGTYEQAFYVGNQIQLATDAPQLEENNDKLSEVILKLDTKLDVAISTRLAAIDYIDPATAQEVWEYTTRTLTSAGSGGATLEEIEGSLILAKEATSAAIKAKTDKMEFNAQNHIAANVHQLQAGAITSIQNGLSLEATSQDIKTTVDALTNYDDTTAQGKLDAIKTKTDTLVNTDLTGIATSVDVTNAQTAIEAKIDAIPATDLTGITDDLTIINEGVKKASLFIPHTQNL